MNDQTQRIFVQSLGIAVFIPIAAIFLLIPQFFALPPTGNKIKAILGYVPYAFDNSLYVLVLILITIASIVAAWFFFQTEKTPFGGEKYVRVIRGLQLVSPFKLKGLLKKGEKGYQIRFCGLPVPKDLKYKHFLLTGGTGQGKSVAISDFLQSCVDEPDHKTRLIIIDPNGTYLSRFYKKGDVIFNPFDARSVQWSILNEIKNVYDIETYSLTCIPKSPDPNHESFNNMARTVVNATMNKLLYDPTKSQIEKTTLFYDMLLLAPDDELKQFLQGTEGGTVFSNDELVGSIRTIITTCLRSHKNIQFGNFSFRDYLNNGQGNIFITWKEDQMVALQSLISCVTDVVCSSLLSDFDNYSDFIFCVDELASLKYISYLEPVLTKGRKHGLVALSGIQGLSQLNKIYGREDAQTLRGCFSSFGVCALNSQDTYTPQEFEKSFGSIEVLRYKKPQNRNGHSTQAKETERVVKAEEISALKPLHFYLRFSGHYPPTLTKMPYKNYEKVADDFLPV